MVQQRLENVGRVNAADAETEAGGATDEGLLRLSRRMSTSEKSSDAGIEEGAKVGVDARAGMRPRRLRQCKVHSSYRSTTVSPLFGLSQLLVLFGLVLGSSLAGRAVEGSMLKEWSTRNHP